MHPLAVTGVGEARADQGLAQAYRRQRGQGIERIGQGGLVVELLQGLIVVGDAGRGVTVPALTLALLAQLTPALAQQGGLARPVGTEQGDPVAGAQPEPLGPQQGRQGGGRAHVERLQPQQGVGGQPQPVQFEPPGGAGTDLALLLPQPDDPLLHGLGLAHQLGVVMLPSPDGEPLAAGAQAVDLLLLISPALAGALVLLYQRRPGLAAGQGEAIEASVPQDQGVLGDPVEQASIVGDQHQGPAPAL
ncbi:hypothetical protein D3C78_1021930 [compost metagenome]